MGISAQISLYPLRVARLSPAIDEVLGLFRERGLDVIPGPMSSVITGDDAAVFGALQEAWEHTAGQAEVVMVVTFSNACPLPPARARPKG